MGTGLSGERKTQWSAVAGVVITVLLNLVILAWTAGSIKATVTSELARTREELAELRGTVDGMRVLDSDHEARIRVIEALDSRSQKK